MEGRASGNSSTAKLGVLIAGLAGSNGTTFTSAVLTDRRNLTWRTKKGEQKLNWFGSLVLNSTSRVHSEYLTVFETINRHGARKNLKFHEPSDLVIGGWDVNAANLYEGAVRAKVLEPDLLD